MKVSELRDVIDKYLSTYEDCEVFIEVNGLRYRASEAFDGAATPEQPSIDGWVFIVSG